MAQIIDGKQLARERLTLLKKQMETTSVRPGIAGVLIGDNEASRVYIRIKERRCADLGIYFEKIILPESVDTQTVIQTIKTLNTRPEIHAILVQLPLPAPIETEKIINAIAPAKDVDGFHPENIQRFMADTPPYVRPVLIKAILALLASTEAKVHNKKAVILGKSDVFMRPLGSALLRLGMQVMWQTVSHPSWQEHTQQADVLITALGRPHSILPEQIKKGAIAIDVGITKQNGMIKGDISPEAQSITSWYTPVPGGVGPMTVAMLMENVIEMAQRRSSGTI